MSENEKLIEKLQGVRRQLSAMIISSNYPENRACRDSAIDLVCDIISELKSPTPVSLEKLGEIAYKAFGESGFYAYSAKEQGEYVAKAILDAANVKWK